MACSAPLLSLIVLWLKTVGTQLAERGAKLHTIMKVLGHTSASMTITCAQISDREVLKDYQAVLGPGATLAGPFAETSKLGNYQPHRWIGSSQIGSRPS
jgi:hypothetical protein